MRKKCCSDYEIENEWLGGEKVINHDKLYCYGIVVYVEEGRSKKSNVELWIFEFINHCYNLIQEEEYFGGV